MTELQKIELDILKSVIDICDELNLKYYLVCGSALGAVKYNGFIPWDDDIDIGLPREDYEIFIQKAQAMLPEYYFLQNYNTDKNFPLFMTKIRDSRTTFVEMQFQNIDMHHGVYIDVFPLDGYPNKRKAIKKKHLCASFLLHRLETIFAINFSTFNRSERNLCLSTTFCANCIIHFSASSVVLSAFFSAIRTSFWFVYQSFFCIKFLFSNGKNKFHTAVFTD